MSGLRWMTLAEEVDDLLVHTVRITQLRFAHAQPHRACFVVGAHAFFLRRRADVAAELHAEAERDLFPIGAPANLRAFGGVELSHHAPRLVVIANSPLEFLRLA